MSQADSKQTGTVFNIQKYSVHDGPGIRTVVFLKGCPLHCRWCSNPESQHLQPELAYNREKCLTLDACVRCVEVCTTGAIKRDDDNRVRIDRHLCDQCLACAGVCPSSALIVYGRTMSVSDVIATVEEDGAFYSRSGGGMTLSGGEPMQQPDFSIAILQEARRRRINTAMETCGYCNPEVLETACRSLNTLLYDIKVMDPEKHRQCTGVTNERILENFKMVRRVFPDLPIRVRTPIIPGVNDSEDEIRKIMAFISEFSNVEYEMLPYHRLGKPKYEYLGGEWPMGEATLDDGVMRALIQLLETEFSHLAVKSSGQKGRRAMME